MKQLLYLCAEKDAGRFNALFQSLNLLAVQYNLENVQSLTAFVQRERTIATQDYMIFDLSEADFSSNHVLNAVQNLRMLSAAELIFIAKPCAETTKLFGNLSSKFHCRSTIEKQDEQTLLSQVKACLTGENSPMKFAESIVQQSTVETIEAVTPKPLEIPDGLVLDVAVAGVMERCGTTTQAFALYHALREFGFHPALLDNSGTMLETMWTLYRKEPGSEKLPQGIRIFGVDMVSERSADYDVYVRDMGVLSEWNAGAFCDADISALVIVTKPWELPKTMPKVQFARQAHADKPLIVLANSTTPTEAARLEKALGKLLPASYRPDIFDEQLPEGMKQQLTPYIKQACGIQQEFRLDDLFRQNPSFDADLSLSGVG